MIFTTFVVLTLCVAPAILNVKVVIDGTIDLGPNWNYEYKLRPIFSPKHFLRDSAVSSKSAKKSYREEKHVHNDIKIKNDEVTEPIGINKTANEEVVTDNKALKALRTAEDDYEPKDLSDDVADGSGVTSLFKVSGHEPLFKRTRAIEDEPKIVEFIRHIYNESIKTIIEIGEKLKPKNMTQEHKRKIIELKDKFANKFGQFVNETKHHVIKTSLGAKKVIINSIDSSFDLLNKLVMPLKLCPEFTNSGAKVKDIRRKLDKFKTQSLDNACKIFGVCRVGKELSDYIESLILILLKGDDTKVLLAVDSLTEKLERANFSRIMDDDTQQRFKAGMSKFKELYKPLNIRFILMTFKLAINNRHLPLHIYSDRDRYDGIKSTLALYYVIETMNNNFKIDKGFWTKIKKQSNDWVNGNSGDVKVIIKDLVEHIQNGVANLDDIVAEDIKAKMKLITFSQSSKRINSDLNINMLPSIIF